MHCAALLLLFQMFVISLVFVGNVLLFLRSMPFYSATADSEIGSSEMANA